MSMPLGPAWANGYLSVDVDTAALGLDLSELDVSVDGGPDVGVVSAGIEPPNPDGTRRIRVLPAACR
jgi:hypothetical protein